MDELMTLQDVYGEWPDILPPSLKASATADPVRAICKFDLSELESVDLLRRFRRD